MDLDVERLFGAVERSVSSLERGGQAGRAVTVARSYATTVEDLWDAATSAERIERWLVPTQRQPRTRQSLLTGGKRRGHDYALRASVVYRADVGVAVDKQALAGYLAFRRDWLRGHDLRPQKVSLFEMTDRRMEPTLRNGDSALVDHSQCELYNNVVYALNAGGILIVKRVGGGTGAGR